MKRTVSKTATRETDNAYVLKVLLYFILGTIWIKIDGKTVLPVGVVLGLIYAHKDHFAIDRKIEYAILIVSALVVLATGRGVFVAF